MAAFSELSATFVVSGADSVGLRLIKVRLTLTSFFSGEATLGSGFVIAFGALVDFATMVSGDGDLALIGCAFVFFTGLVALVSATFAAGFFVTFTFELLTAGFSWVLLTCAGLLVAGFAAVLAAGFAAAFAGAGFFLDFGESVGAIFGIAS